MTIEELHQKLSLLARSGMQDNAFLVQLSKKRLKPSNKFIAEVDLKESKKIFYIQTRLFD